MLQDVIKLREYSKYLFMYTLNSIHRVQGIHSSMRVASIAIVYLFLCFLYYFYYNLFVLPAENWSHYYTDFFFALFGFLSLLFVVVFAVHKN